MLLGVKRCCRCGLIKPHSAFHKWNQRDGYQQWCKPCRKEYDHAYYALAKDRHSQGRTESRARRLEWMRELKRNKPCADCGGIFPPEAMQWDHLPGFIKLGDISSSFMASADRRLLLEELAKCELVCANCHAIRTCQRRRGVAQPGRARRLGR